MVDGAEDPKDDTQRALGSLLVFIMLGMLGFFVFVQDSSPLESPVAGAVGPIDRKQR